MLKIQNFVNGEFRAPQSEKYFENFDPATGQAYSLVPDSEAVDVVLAIQAATKAFDGWSKTSAKDRSKILLKVAEILERRMEEFVQAESRDVGKPQWLAREMDIPRAIENFQFFATRILHKEETATDMNGKALNYTLRLPVGVAGLISPWNLPLYLLTWKIAPALAVGDTVVCKPSEITPMTAYMLGEVLSEAGVPPGVCNIIHGKGDPAGSTLVSHPGVPLISFTGGTETGEKIGKLAAPHFKKLSLELGGKNATVVFADANMETAVKGVVRSSFLNQGEICLCGSRIYVQEGVYKEFLAEFVKATKSLTVGDPKDPNTFMGPVVSRGHLDKIKTCIKQATDEKGDLLAGDEALTLAPELKNGYFIRPTVVADLTNCSDLWVREIFGPVVTITSFKYANDAVKWANTSPYGLSASIWTKDLTKAHQTAAKINAGTVWVNTWLKRDLRVPFGGMKASGLGREGGDHSFDFFTETKNICVELS